MTAAILTAVIGAPSAAALLVGLWLLAGVGHRPRPHVVLVHRRDDENAAPRVIPCGSYGFASQVRSDLLRRLDPVKYSITIEPAGGAR